MARRTAAFLVTWVTLGCSGVDGVSIVAAPGSGGAAGSPATGGIPATGGSAPIGGAAGAAGSPAIPAAGGAAGDDAMPTVTFDFDSAWPILRVGQNLPFDQTAGDVTAHFESPQGAAFSIQTDDSTGWSLSDFRRQYLYDNDVSPSTLDITFDRTVTAISLRFATADFHQAENPTSLALSAYVGSTASATVATASAHGEYAGDTMPMGTLALRSEVPFDVVEIALVSAPNGATVFLVDDLTVSLQ